MRFGEQIHYSRAGEPNLGFSFKSSFHKLMKSDSANYDSGWDQPSLHSCVKYSLHSAFQNYSEQMVLWLRYKC